MTAVRRHPPIVVGVDGSATAGPALRWAIREASTRRIPIQLVSAWNPSYDIDTLGLARRTVEDHCEVILNAARKNIAEVDPSIEVTTTAYIGPATTALVDASLHADTVVVGSRGRRTLPAFLLEPPRSRSPPTPPAPRSSFVSEPMPPPEGLWSESTGHRGPATPSLTPSDTRRPTT
jgi:nucleotide-binding universal stress UspA family protein